MFSLMFQRHLRNAHPGLGEDLRDNTDSGGDNEGDMLGHHMDDSDRVSCPLYLTLYNLIVYICSILHFRS